MKYIGPFLKLNPLSSANIKNQLFHLAKESEKLLVFYSAFGLTSDSKKPEVILKSYYDINTFKAFSPLLCIYKKGDLKLENVDKKLCFQENKFKKDIIVFSNMLMTLSLIELVAYYGYIDRKLDTSHGLSKIYKNVAKNQMEFYLTYLRNTDGFFVDKKEVHSEEEFKFEPKSKSFLFSDQAFAMAVFEAYSKNCNDNTAFQYKNFSEDIFDMLLGCKDSLYSLPYTEISKLIFALLICYFYSKDTRLLSFIFDLYDFSYENIDAALLEKDFNALYCLFIINSMLLFQYTNIEKFKDNALKTFETIKPSFHEDKCIFIKDSSKKEVKNSSTSLMLFVICNLLLETSENEFSNIYKTIIEDSNIIRAFPKAPKLDHPERYTNFSLTSEDLLEEINFRPEAVKSSEINLLLPFFTKEVIYNTKKACFTSPKNNFLTSQNMFLFFLFIFLFKPSVNCNEEPSHKSKKHHKAR